MNDKERAEHNRTFEEAAALVKDEILLHERPRMVKPGWFLRRRLKRALALFGRVLELKPENWSAMWLVAKVHQRLGDTDIAFSWLEKAYQVNSSQSDIAREASMMAMDLGKEDAAIVFAHRGTQIEPENAGLHANLALAYLQANQLPEAKKCVDRALEVEPNDTISQTIREMILHFADRKETPPSTTRGLQEYWAKKGE